MSLSALVPFQVVSLGAQHSAPPLSVAHLPGIENFIDAATTPRWHREGSSNRSENASAAASAPGGGKIVVAYAPAADSAGAPIQNPLLAPVPPVDTGTDGLHQAIAAYHAGNLAEGDDLARQLEDPLSRTTLEWIALRLSPRLPFERVTAFLAAHPDWPAADYLRRRAEVALYSDRRSPVLINAFFAARPPETVYGKLALARAKLAADPPDNKSAASLVREVWLSGDIGTLLEAAILREFHDLLSKADHKARSDKLFFEGLDAAARRAAVLAGPDEEALSKARDNPTSHVLVAALPAADRNDPSLIFAKIRALRERSKFADAAKTALEASDDSAAPDDWWTERRRLARKLLDAGDAKTAYRLCAQALPASDEMKLEAEFEAGWIALRFLHDSAAAASHFAEMTRIAVAPQSVARAAYWQGRTAEVAGKSEAATGFYRIAAAHATTYYGQLARAKLGKTDIPLPTPGNIAEGARRAEVVRVVELLEALDERDIALPLAIDAARRLDDESQVAALAEVVSKTGDARATLLVGKAAINRGFALDAWAFPTFGIPAFDPIGKSAAAPIVYSIARQESAFATGAVSRAGAIGLMQMIVSTARRTAAQIGVPFDETKLLKDATFNAQLGAAHLGELLHDNGGSMILTFAAYNAGSKRVKQWIDAYGDPRKPNVDPVDWVERIPIDETRNYVQRVIENLQTYRERFGDAAPLKIESDLR
jgi:soluble lytic murein transglycosylase